MNNWIAVDCDMRDDPKTRAVARATHMKPNECVGAIVAVLSKMRRMAQTGSLADVDNATLNEWAGYKSDATFAGHFVKQFCDDKRKVGAWMKYNGRMIAKNKRDVARIRKYREKKKLERRNGNGDATRIVTRTKRGRSRSPNPTQPNPSGVGGGGGAAGALEPLGAQALPEVKALALVIGSPDADERKAMRIAAGFDR